MCYVKETLQAERTVWGGGHDSLTGWWREYNCICTNNISVDIWNIARWNISVGDNSNAMRVITWFKKRDSMAKTTKLVAFLGLNYATKREKTCLWDLLKNLPFQIDACVSIKRFNMASEGPIINRFLRLRKEVTVEIGPGVCKVPYFRGRGEFIKSVKEEYNVEKRGSNIIDPLILRLFGRWKNIKWGRGERNFRE